jgi:hypothetical protein
LVESLQNFKLFYYVIVEFSPDDQVLVTATLGCVVRSWPCEDEFALLVGIGFSFCFGC